MMAEDREYQWQEFLYKNGKLDEIRGENFSEVFPEFS